MSQSFWVVAVLAKKVTCMHGKDNGEGVLAPKIWVEAVRV